MANIVRMFLLLGLIGFGANYCSSSENKYPTFSDNQTSDETDETSSVSYDQNDDYNDVFIDPQSSLMPADQIKDIQVLTGEPQFFSMLEQNQRISVRAPQDPFVLFLRFMECVDVNKKSHYEVGISLEKAEQECLLKQKAMLKIFEEKHRDLIPLYLANGSVCRKDALYIFSEGAQAYGLDQEFKGKIFRIHSKCDPLQEKTALAAIYTGSPINFFIKGRLFKNVFEDISLPNKRSLECSENLFGKRFRKSKSQ